MTFQKGNQYGKLSIGKKRTSEQKAVLSKRIKEAYARGLKLGYQKGHKVFPGIEKTQFKKGLVPWNKGKHHSEETKAKISKTRIRLNKKQCPECGIMYQPYFKRQICCSKICSGIQTTKRQLGSIISGEIRNKISKTLMGRKNPEHSKRMMGKFLGSKSPNWKGGITPINLMIRSSREYKIWRSAVFQRDNHTCQYCKRKGCYLVAHHINSFSKFPELRFNIDNGITLCKECHKLTGNYAGRERCRKFA